jgi:hypothetical protein
MWMTSNVLYDLLMLWNLHLLNDRECCILRRWKKVDKPSRKISNFSYLAQKYRDVSKIVPACKRKLCEISDISWNTSYCNRIGTSWVGLQDILFLIHIIYLLYSKSISMNTHWMRRHCISIITARRLLICTQYEYPTKELPKVCRCTFPHTRVLPTKKNYQADKLLMKIHFILYC